MLSPSAPPSPCVPTPPRLPQQLGEDINLDVLGTRNQSGALSGLEGSFGVPSPDGAKSTPFVLAHGDSLSSSKDAIDHTSEDLGDSIITRAGSLSLEASSSESSKEVDSSNPKVGNVTHSHFHARKKAKVGDPIAPGRTKAVPTVNQDEKEENLGSFHAPSFTAINHDRAENKNTMLDGQGSIHVGGREGAGLDWTWRNISTARASTTLGDEEEVDPVEAMNPSSIHYTGIPGFDRRL